MSVLHTGEDVTRDGDRETVRVHASRMPEHHGEIAVWIVKSYQADRGGSFNLEWDSGSTAAWVRRQDGEYRQPFMLLEDGTARALFDALWSAGLRTKESLESGAHRTAIEGHLSDMRELVAHFAKVQLPGTKGGGDA